VIHKGQKTTWRLLLAALMVLVAVGGLFTAQPAAAAPTGDGIDIGNMGNTTEPAEGISPDGTTLCAVWSTFDQGDSNAVYVRLYNTATGAVSPSSAYQLSSAPTIGKAHCAIDGKGNVHAVWQECSGSCRIAYRMLPAGSNPASGWTSLYAVEYDRDGPDIDALYADANGQVWLAYRQYPGSFQVRNYANGSWSGATTISADGNAEKVRIGVDNAGFVSLTWRDGNNGAAYAYRDPSNGQFSSRFIIPGSNGAGISSLAVDRTNGDVHIAYSKNFTELHYVKGGRGGTNFSDRIIVQAAQATLQPRIAWSANGRIIIAFDNNNKASIDAITSEDRGGSLGAPVTIARPGGGAQAPWVVADTTGGAYILYAHTSGARVYLTTIAGTGGGTTTPPPATTTPPAISNVAATPKTLTSETISWTTDTSSSSRVFFSVSGVPVDTTCTTPSCTAGDATLTTTHEVTLRGLAPNTTYNYQVRATDGSGQTTLDAAVHTFTTSSLEIVGNNQTSDGKFSALVYAPAGANSFTWRAADGSASGTFRGTQTTKAQVVAFSGDLTPNGESTTPKTFSITVTNNTSNVPSTAATIQYNTAFRAPFSDVDVTSASPYAVAIYELQGRGIVKGSDGRFRPVDPVARAEAAAIVARSLTWIAEHGANSFSDLAAVDTELQNDVRVLADYGVARGFGDGTYQPTSSIAQAQIISLITRAMVAKGYWTLQNDNSSFPNVPASSGHRQDIITFDFYTKAFSTDPSFFSDSNYASPAERRFVARIVYEAVKWRENQATGASLYELP